MRCDVLYIILDLLFVGANPARGLQPSGFRG
jgi:hypothetical protein